VEVEWRYAGAGPSARIRIDLETTPPAKPAGTEREGDPCREFANALTLFSKREYTAASMALDKASGPLLRLDADPSTARAAGLIKLRGGKPEEAVKWWTVLADYDDIGKIYLATTLAATGHHQAAYEEARKMRASVELTGVQYREVRMDFSTMAFEAAGLAVLPPKKSAGPTIYKIVKASAHKTVSWDYGDYLLSEDRTRVVAKFAETARRLPGIIRITGYASEFGAEKVNLALAQKRADEVVNALLASGIQRSRIVVNVDEGFPLKEWMLLGEFGRGGSCQVE